MPSLLARVVHEVGSAVLPNDRATLGAEVAAMVALAARDEQPYGQHGRAPIVLEFDAEPAAARFVSAFSKLFGTTPAVAVHSGGHAHRYEVFRVTLPLAAPIGGGWLARELDVTDQRRALAIWRAALLCAAWIPGSRSTPALGVGCRTRRVAETVRRAAATLGVEATVQRRRHYDRVLVADAAQAVELLRRLGVTRAAGTWAAREVAREVVLTASPAA